ncbi:hypothetical protein [Moorena sp. SIO2C4]|uniref:hypothetical protein n=1 Tax=Moorena sp. SIO2C4 TaxID=2607824 RepID=UPI00338D58B9
MNAGTISDRLLNFCVAAVGRFRGGKSTIITNTESTKSKHLFAQKSIPVIRGGENRMVGTLAILDISKFW